MFDLTGRRVLVTGGSAGIGNAVAERFIAAGAKVVISGRRPETPEIAKAMGAIGVVADLSELEGVDFTLEQAADQLGSLDIAINNAGVAWPSGNLSEAKMDDLDAMMAVNFRSSYRLLSSLPKFMKNGGSIVNTASISGMSGEKGLSAYAASKAALLNLSQTAALELAPRGIRVNSVSPGPIRTDIYSVVDYDPLALSRIVLPLGRMGEVDDCVGAYHFLASDEARFVTGINLVVDGGFMAGTSAMVDQLVIEATQKG